MGALTLARFYFDRNDLKGAQAQLQWVVERSSSDEFRDLARLRLAALLLDQKQYDQALKQLAEKHAAAFDAQYEALKGDVLVASGKPAEAKAAYKAALDKAGKSENLLRETVRVRLDALGG
jgi:predicted negative regulator of RcsB-dependent stress response